MAKKFIAGAIKRPGRLHRYFGVPESETIPVSKLRELAKSDKGTLDDAARLALHLRKMNPWDIEEEAGKFWVVKDDTRERVHDKPHATREEAEKHMRALYSAEGISETEYRRKKAGGGSHTNRREDY